MSILVNQFVAAHVSKSTASGTVTPPAAGTVPTADGAGGADWLPGGSGVTLASAGGTETLVNDGTGPALAVKGLTAGPGVTLTGAPTDITVTNASPASSVVLASAGGTETLVNDGTGPALATKGLTAGAGVTLTGSATDVTITNASPASSVALASAGGTETLVNDGTGPALALKGLTAGTGIALTGAATAVTVAVDQPVSVTAYRQWGAFTTPADAVGSTAMFTGVGPSAAGSQVIPANSLVQGSTYVLKAAGQFISAIGPPSTTILGFSFELNGVPVAAASLDFSLFAPGGTGTFLFDLALTFMCEAVGVGGSVVGSGNLQMQNSGVVVPPPVATFVGFTPNSGTVAVNTTIGQTMNLISSQTTSSAGQTVMIRYAYVEKK